jgi:hypothetical protein
MIVSIEKTRRRAFARQRDYKEVGELGGETELAPQQDVTGEKKVDDGTQVRLGRLFPAIPTKADGVDHLRLVITVLQDPRGPVREFEPPSPVFAGRPSS